MFTVSELETFGEWLEGLKDRKGAGVIASRSRTDVVLAKTLAKALE